MTVTSVNYNDDTVNFFGDKDYCKFTMNDDSDYCKLK